MHKYDSQYQTHHCDDYVKFLKNKLIAECKKTKISVAELRAIADLDTFTDNFEKMKQSFEEHLSIF